MCAVSQAGSACSGGVGLDGVKGFLVAGERVALEQAALLAGRPGAHVRLRERLQLVQLLGQFPQHASAEAGAALGHGSTQAVRKKTTCRETHRHLDMQDTFTYRIDMMTGCMLTCFLARLSLK